jgi:ABC-type tungstate transport system substrate-binding protein
VELATFSLLDPTVTSGLLFVVLLSLLRPFPFFRLIFFLFKFFIGDHFCPIVPARVARVNREKRQAARKMRLILRQEHVPRSLSMRFTYSIPKEHMQILKGNILVPTLLCFAFVPFFCLSIYFWTNICMLLYL